MKAAHASVVDQSAPSVYHLVDQHSCTCQDAQRHPSQACKHVLAARRPIFVCTKGRRHQQLLDEYESKRQGQNGLRRLEAERVLDRAVLGLTEIGTREMALIAHIVSRSSTHHFHGDDRCSPMRRW
jgi:hypothetical protein